jgi:outer membrane protein assembly factor BamB
MIRTIKSVFLFVIFTTVTASIANAQEWTQWRGPNRDGVVASFSAPRAWPKNLTQKWKTEVGGGYSSPIVSGSRIYLHTRRDEEEIVSCIDLNTGKTIWSKNYNAAFNKNQYAVKMGKGPNSTPALHAGKLYTLGVTAILSCFDAKTGDLKWRKDFSKDIDTSKLFCGTSMSPVIDRGLLIVHVGDDRKGWVIAFDAETGKEKWKWEGDGPGYASPIVAEFEGARQAITLTDKSVIGISVDSGKLLWKFPFPDEWNENIITPLVHGKNLIVSGVRQGTKSIRLSKDGDQWKATEVWSNPKIAMYMSSPILDGDHLYGLSHLRKGQFFCLDARTGEVLWTTEGREGPNASLLDAKNVLFLLTSDADLIVADKGAKGFKQAARYTVANSPTWAHPVVLGHRILIKDEANLTLWSID